MDSTRGKDGTAQQFTRCTLHNDTNTRLEAKKIQGQDQGLPLLTMTD